MADNLGYTPGTGKTIRSRDLGGDIHQQIMELAPANVSIKTTGKTVSTTAALLSSQLSGRIRITIQNRGTVSVYVGPSGVTANSADATDGLEIAPGQSLTANWGPSIDPHAVSADGSSQNVRVLEES